MMRLFNELKKNNNDWGLHLRVQKVPEVLSRLRHIKILELEFTGKVVLPEWMDRMIIDEFIVKGKMTSAEKTAIKKRFPNISF